MNEGRRKKSQLHGNKAWFILGEKIYIRNYTSRFFSILQYIMLEKINFHEKVLKEYEQDKTKFDSGYIEWVKQVLKKDCKNLSLMQQYGI